MIVFDNTQLWKQFERHKAAVDFARDRWLDDLSKSPDHPDCAATRAAFKEAMADLDLDIELLWRAAREGEIPTD